MTGKTFAAGCSARRTAFPVLLALDRRSRLKVGPLRGENQIEA
jgi:hypothetical protein